MRVEGLYNSNTATDVGVIMGDVCGVVRRYCEGKKEMQGPLGSED